MIACWPNSSVGTASQSGTRQMIQVLSLIRQHGHGRVRAAIEEALALGCSDVAAIRHLAEAADLVRARSTIMELGALAHYNVRSLR